MSRALLQHALDALETGRDAAQEVSARFHDEMSGYDQQRHDSLDADLQSIDAAIYALRAALAAPSVPAGWRLVPVEPTREMREAGERALCSWLAPALHAADAYRAMIDVAPSGEESK